ncbi:MAG: 50S ribosomal protein L24 [Candidatus Paceibacterota bacterium]|jgi:large subunit ribosomal protein L24
MIKKGDNVIITTGKDKGKSGSVEKVFPKEGKLIVAGLNILKRHRKSRKSNEKGTIIDVASPLDISNVKKVK